MRASIATRKLRGSDPLAVEIEAQSLATRPLSQLSLENVSDLMALELREDISHPLRAKLRGFSARMARALSDLPAVSGFDVLIKDLLALNAERLTPPLRAMVQAEAERRKLLDRDDIATLLARWEAEEALPWNYGTHNKPRHIVSHHAVPPPAEPVRDGQARAAAAERKPRAARTPQARELRSPVDAQRAGWLRQTCLERLSSSRGGGLLENVLFASIKYRAKTQYPDISETEIRQCLEQLVSSGLARREAKRWRIVGAGF